MENSKKLDRRLARIIFRALYSVERWPVPRGLWLHIKALESYNVRVALSGGQIKPITTLQFHPLLPNSPGSQAAARIGWQLPVRAVMWKQITQVHQ